MPNGRSETWTGPPPAEWAAEDLLQAIAAGKAPPAAIVDYMEHGGDGSLALALEDRTGTAFQNFLDTCRANPYIAPFVATYDLLAAAIEWVIEELPEFISTIGEIWDWVEQTSTEFFSSARVLLADAAIWLDETMDAIVGTMEEWRAKILDMVTVGWNTVGNYISMASTWISDQMDRAYLYGKGLLESAFDYVEESLREAWNSASEFFYVRFGKTWEDALTYINESWAVFADFTARIWETIEDIWEAVADWAQGIWDWFVDQWGPRDEDEEAEFQAQVERDDPTEFEAGDHDWIEDEWSEDDWREDWEDEPEYEGLEDLEFPEDQEEEQGVNEDEWDYEGMGL